jgi:hypothetical protein
MEKAENPACAETICVFKPLVNEGAPVGFA